MRIWRYSAVCCQCTQCNTHTHTHTHFYIQYTVCIPAVCQYCPLLLHWGTTTAKNSYCYYSIILYLFKNSIQASFNKYKTYSASNNNSCRMSFSRKKSNYLESLKIASPFSPSLKIQNLWIQIHHFKMFSQHFHMETVFCTVKLKHPSNVTIS